MVNLQYGEQGDIITSATTVSQVLLRRYASAALSICHDSKPALKSQVMCSLYQAIRLSIMLLLTIPGTSRNY